MFTLAKHALQNQVTTRSNQLCNSNLHLQKFMIQFQVLFYKWVEVSESIVYPTFVQKTETNQCYSQFIFCKIKTNTECLFFWKNIWLRSSGFQFFQSIMEISHNYFLIIFRHRNCMKKSKFPLLQVFLGKACTVKPGHNGVKSIIQFAFAKIHGTISLVIS